MVSTAKPERDDSRALLEWELGLDSSDMRSHAWYHGIISKEFAETLVHEENSFLVRDSTSKFGEFVLTCRCNGSVLHFAINRTIIPPYAEGFPNRIQYSFEDASFDSVPGLITFTVCSRKPISMASGAIISSPVARSVPLCIQSQVSEVLEDHPMEGQLTLSTQFSSLTLDSRLPVRNDSSSSIVSSSASSTFSNRSSSALPTASTYQDKQNRFGSFSGSSIGLDRSVTLEPIYANAYQEYMRKRESEDFAYFSDYSDNRSAASKDEYSSYIISSAYSSSRVDPIAFATYLLPKNNKPLDGSAINKIRSTVLDTGARLLANHVTRADLEFIYHTEHSVDLGMGVGSGIELLLLPQGDRYRKDFIDRFKCFQYFIVTSVLTSQSEKERAAILDKWIQIGLECRTGLGNLMAFAAIVRTLLLPTITRLKRTWLMLRQLFTQSAVTFESKMKPMLKAMNECRDPIAPNTTYPYILPSVEIIDRHLSRLKVSGSDEIDSPEALKNFSLGLEIEKIGTDYGLEIIYSHLQFSRQIVSQSPIFKRNAQILFEDVQLEELLIDMFRTEFHRRFLWGTKGSAVEPNQRYEKLDQLVALLSSKCELD